MKRYQVLISETAIKDLKNIVEYIQQYDEATASRLAIRLLSACDDLEIFPNRGRIGIEPGTRELVHIKNFIITFEVGKNIVRVLNFYHQAQDR